MPTNFEIHETLCAPGQFFEMETVDIRGFPTRTWKNASPNLGAVLRQGAAKGGDADFIVYEDERISHQHHLELVESFATSLVDEMGVRKGDRVAIAMRNLPEWSVAFFATTLVGAVAVPLNAFASTEELAYTLTDCDASVIIGDGERLERLAGAPEALKDRRIVGTRLDDRKGARPLPPDIVAFETMTSGPARDVSVEVGPEDLATIFYTSCTTSRPKGVVGTHRNICTNLVSIMFTSARTGIRDGIPPAAPAGPPVTLLCVPLFHATGCHTMLLSAAFFGGRLILMRRWDPEVALDLMERERASGFGAVPAMLWDIINSPSLDRRDLSSVRGFGAGGAASPPELARRVKERFPDSGVGTGYGLTETSSLTTSIGGTDYQIRTESVGVPIPVCEIRIVDTAGRDVAENEPGEIWIQGPNVVVGYWKQPELTAETFTDGFLHTGDIGRRDEEGFLYIVDRAKDIVIRGGENISTLEVEYVLLECPGVREVAVFAVPHPTLGEEVGAVIYADKSRQPTADELRAHVASVLAAHKVPTHIWFSDDPLPRGDTGKFLKRAVKEKYLAK